MRGVLLVLLGLAASISADDAALQPAVEAARRREDRLKTVLAEWKITAFVPKGGRMEADPVGLALPRTDVTVESTHRFVLDRDRYRADHNDPGVRMMVPVAFDGSRAFDGQRSYLRSYHQGRDKPAQMVVEASRGRDFGPYAGRPLALWCRATALEPYGGREHELASSAPAEIDGNEMLEVRYPSSRVAHVTYWLDSRRDYLVRRVRVESAGMVEVSDVEYAERPGVGWVPTGWTVVKTRDGGKLVQRTRAEVTTLRVDEAVPPETFRLDPLPGESVHDNDAHKSYQVRADGSLAEGDEPGEVRPTGDGTDRLLPAWPGRSLVRYVLLPGLFVGVLGAVVLRRRRRAAYTIPMNFAFSTNAYLRFSFPEACRRLAAIGYPAVEIMADVPHAWPAYILPEQKQGIRDALAANNLQISNVNSFMMHAVDDHRQRYWHPSWIEPDYNYRRVRIDHTRRALTLAKELGAKCITTEPGGPVGPGESWHAVLKLFVEMIKPVAEHAEKEGVLLLVEPEPGLLIENSEQAEEFMGQMTSPAVGLNFDIGHQFCVGEDPALSIKRLAKWVRHVHLEDIAPTRVHHHLIPGEGAIDFARVLKAIQEIGYTGWVTVELYPYTDDPDHAARTALERVKAIEAGLR